MRQPSPVNTFGGPRTLVAWIHPACDRRTVGVVVDKLEAVLVEGRAEVRLRNGETDTIREALAEGTGRNLNAVGVAGLRVTRGQ